MDAASKSKNDITSLIRTVRIFSEDIRMEFGLVATAALARVMIVEGAEKHQTAKDKGISTSALGIPVSIPCSHGMQHHKTYALSVVTYTADIVNWTREELQTMDRR